MTGSITLTQLRTNAIKVEWDVSVRRGRWAAGREVSSTPFASNLLPRWHLSLTHDDTNVRYRLHLDQPPAGVHAEAYLSIGVKRHGSRHVTIYEDTNVEFMNGKKVHEGPLCACRNFFTNHEDHEDQESKIVVLRIRDNSDVVNLQPNTPRLVGLDEILGCGLNSVLQPLFHLRAVRAGVSTIINTRGSPMAAAVQTAFKHLMEAPNGSSETTALALSMGWKKDEFPLLGPQGVLEKMVNDNGLKSVFADFEGRLTQFSTWRGENRPEMQDVTFRSLTFDVKKARRGHNNKTDLEDALWRFIGKEAIEMEIAGRGTVKAERMRLLISPPQIMAIHLRRFPDERVKGKRVDDRYTYPEELNMADFRPFKDAKTNEDGEDYKWKLFAVISHCGYDTAYGGEFMSFVNDGRQWIRFRDEEVHPSSVYQAVENNFGDDQSDDEPWQGVQAACALIYVKATEWARLVGSTMQRFMVSCRDQGLQRKLVTVEAENVGQIKHALQNQVGHFQNKRIRLMVDLGDHTTVQVLTDDAEVLWGERELVADVEEVVPQGGAEVRVIRFSLGENRRHDTPFFVVVHETEKVDKLEQRLKSITGFKEIELYDEKGKKVPKKNSNKKVRVVAHLAPPRVLVMHHS